MPKYVRTKLSNELHGELKKSCAIEGESMQDRVADLIAKNLESGNGHILAARLAEKSKDDIKSILQTVKQIKSQKD